MLNLSYNILVQFSSKNIVQNTEVSVLLNIKYVVPCYSEVEVSK